jgi:hypothetical protein
MSFTGMLDHVTLADAFGILGALFCIAAYWMRTMVLLRIAGIASNALFAAFGFLQPSYPTLVLYGLLVPLNCIRLYQMTRLVKQVRNSSEGDLSMDWLKPFMSQRGFRKGDVLFRKGDVGEEMFYTLSGQYLVTEIGITLAPGHVLGELAFLAPDQRRTQTVECAEDGQVLTITYDKVRELYFQNPTFGFYFLRLASERFLQNISRLEKALAEARANQPQAVPQA